MIENSLTLKEFIEATLSDVCEAVDAARNKHSYIAPKFFTDPDGLDKATVIDFDIAVTVSDTNSLTDSKSGNLGGGLKISVLRAETNISAEDEKFKSSNSSKESRVKFSIPVYFQFDEEERKRVLNERKNKQSMSKASGSSGWMGA